MKFSSNPYYHPESCGLQILWQIDTGGSYEFDMMILWKKLDDGTLWYDSDSGCSCPIPFDTDRHDLRALTWETLYNFEEAVKHHHGIGEAQIRSAISVAKRELRNASPLQRMMEF